MYKNCTTEQSALRQQQIEECLLQNMLLRPYAEITISDLCGQINISRKSFYRYFSNKDSCLTSLLNRRIIDSSRYSALQSNVPTGIQAEFTRILFFWKENADTLRALISNGLSSLFLDQMYQHVLREEQSFLHHIGVLNQVSLPDALLFSVSGFVALLLKWVEDGCQTPVERMVSTIVPLLTHPLIQETGEH